MCDELGDDSYMQAYVDEAGSTSLCKVSDPKNCGDKELKFAEKWKSTEVETLVAEMARLNGMSTKSLTAETKKWISARAGILNQLIASKSEL